MKSLKKVNYGIYAGLMYLKLKALIAKANLISDLTLLCTKVKLGRIKRAKTLYEYAKYNQIYAISVKI